jgi:hypothetical protein
MLHDTLRKEPIDTNLPDKQFDLFFFSYALGGGDGLLQVTHTPYADEKESSVFTDDYFAFLSNRSGIDNRYIGYFEKVFSHNNTRYTYKGLEDGLIDSVDVRPWEVVDSLIDRSSVEITASKAIPVYKDTAYLFPATDYPVGIQEQNVALRKGMVLDNVPKEQGFNFYLQPIDTSEFENSTKPADSKFIQKEKSELQRKKQQEVEIGIEDSSQVRKDEITDSIVEEEPVQFFQTDFDFGQNTFPIDTSGEVILNEEEPFQYSRVRPYKVKFSTDKLVTQLDNNLLMTTYQKFNPQSPSFTNPDLSVMFKLGITDLFEDHKIIGGFRIPVDFNTSEVFLSYYNLKKRLDKSFTFYRRADDQTFTDRVPYYDIRIPASAGNGTGTVQAKVITNYAEIGLTYPLDVLNSIRTTIAFRNEKYNFKAIEDFSLNLPTYSENWVFLRAEFVHDATLPIATNIREGIRFKAFAEFHKEIPAEQDTILGDIILNLPRINDAYLAVWGLDFRYYQKIHRNIIWANRVSYATSVGTRKLIYYLGGVDGWIGPQFNQNTPINTNNDYAFQTLATNMRGFQPNARNGNSYVLINSEVRFPIFSYLLKTPIRSDFVKNFQIVGFADIGTAWEGPNPFDEDNPAFAEEVTQGPVTVLIKYARNPIIAGYGFGARTTLFGYFIRMDVGWGIDSGERKGPMFQFSLNYDF